MLHSEESERAVISAVLINSKHLGTVDLEPHEFERSKYRDVWAAIQAVAKRGDVVDPLTVGDYLDARKAATTARDVDEIAGSTITANPESYAATVRECAHARRMIDGMRSIADRLKSTDRPQDVAQDLGALSAVVGSGAYREGSVNAGVQAVIDCQDGTSEDDVVHLGVDCLTEYEPCRADLTIVAGRPSMGKTATALFLAERLVDSGMPVVFISAESNSQQIIRRRLSYASRIEVGKLRRRGAVETGDEWDRLTGAVVKLKARESLFRIYDGVFTGPDLLTIIKAEIVRSGVRAVFIDHLGKIRMRGRDRLDIELGHVTEGLAALAKEKSVPIFLAHQLSRKNDERKDPRPIISDLRDSGRIEQDADNIWFVHRPNRYSDTADNTMEILIPKARDGTTGTVDSLVMVNGRVEEK